MKKIYHVVFQLSENILEKPDFRPYFHVFSLIRYKSMNCGQIVK